MSNNPPPTNNPGAGAAPDASDACVPAALTDFVFDLYDCVTLSQLSDEQTRLYQVDFNELSKKYCSQQPWPSVHLIASECNGHPLFLAIYRELTHRHWHATSRPTIRDRVEGWNVYRELFDEILESAQDMESFYLLPQWVFDILHEFVYQFQGFCQIRSAVYSQARKHGLLTSDGKPVTGSTTTTESSGDNATTTTKPSGGGPSSNLIENLSIFQSTYQDGAAWDVESVYYYLHKLVNLGWPKAGSSQTIHPVYTYFSIFSSISMSRYECLLADYTACLQALNPLAEHCDYVIPKDDVVATTSSSGRGAGAAKGMTVSETVYSVFAARISLSYHAGIAYMMLHRYQDAATTMATICSYMLRAFKTGQFQRHYNQSNQGQQGGGGDSGPTTNNATYMSNSYDQFVKQYDRMLALLAIILQICPNQGILEQDTALLRTIRDKYNDNTKDNNKSNKDNNAAAAAPITAMTKYEEWFQCPKFISTNPYLPSGATYRQQVSMFLYDVESRVPSGNTLRSYLKLYTVLPIEKLAKFHHYESAEEFLPVILAYKSIQLRQLERDLSSTTTSLAADEEESGNSNKSSKVSRAHKQQYQNLQIVQHSFTEAGAGYKSCLDIHYYLSGNDIYVNDAEKQRRFENYFVSQIKQNTEIRREAEAIVS